ncbi:vWA domain-containing protein [Candidatus Electronema sp. JC]|uniref:vWA domain-containing protein n=1 Tax=Candidatus Electronema sp. JC TaxID=3401570 RepID=UPI003B42E10A
MRKVLSLTTGAVIFGITTAAQAQIDVVFKIDESGSMQSAIDGVKTNVKTIYDALPSNSHVGLVGYGSWSHCGSEGQIPHVHTPLTADQNVFYNAVEDMVADGGSEQGYRAVYESATDTIAAAWNGSFCVSTPAPSLGFTGAPYCNILITDETPNQGGRTQQEAIAAMTDRGGVFFGIMPTGLFAETQKLADDTGGKLFDLNQFLNNPQPVIAAVLEACVWATSLKAGDGLAEGECLPANSTNITYALDYGNPSQNSIQGVKISHTDGTWGGSSWNEDVGSLSAEASGSATATLPVGPLSPGMKFSNQFTMSSTTPGVAKAVATKETQVCLNLPPVAKCKDIQVFLDANGNAAISPTDIDNGSYDPDEGDHISLSISKSNFTCSDVGVQDFLSLTVTDDSGASNSCVAKVTTVDKVAPVVKTKDVTVQLSASGKASIAVSDVDGGSADNCCIASRSISKNSFTCADVGPQSVTLTVTDCNGNSASAAATVTVADTLAPTNVQANAPATIVPSDAPISFKATATDNCSAAIQITDYSCYKVKKDGSQQSKMESCVVNVSGDTLTVADSGGVGDNIIWTIIATDPSGNATTAEGHVLVANPGSSGETANNGVGNGQDPQPPGNPPVNDGQGTSPGNPGRKGKK